MRRLTGRILDFFIEFEENLLVLLNNEELSDLSLSILTWFFGHSKQVLDHFKINSREIILGNGRVG